MTYPITTDDLLEMNRRKAQGNPLYIPVRSDVQLKDGRTVSNILSWGSPEAWIITFKADEGRFYSKMK